MQVQHSEHRARPQYQYTRLNNDVENIRLLRVRRSLSLQITISARLYDVRFDEALDCKAVSRQWESGDSVQDI